ncbi:hypothetical protein LCGC14_0807720 [marine sediment metagenome]|uniref:Uncharacterized protein n=1 Tax=marine sediment metagenome TaxID=412755 RepID=A0A0F9PS88_9ZZZZ
MTDGHAENVVILYLREKEPQKGKLLGELLVNVLKVSKPKLAL